MAPQGKIRIQARQSCAQLGDPSYPRGHSSVRAPTKAAPVPEYRWTWTLRNWALDQELGKQPPCKILLG